VNPVQVRIDPWAPEFGTAMAGADDLTPTAGDVNLNLEVPTDEWAPLSPGPDATARNDVVFVDGVRRIDARVWVTAADGTTTHGVCASWAAGTVRCNGTATIERCQVERGLFASVEVPSMHTRAATYAFRPAASDDGEALVQAVQECMRDLEGEVSREAGEADLLIVDGPLRGRQGLPNAVGYIKTHRVSYLPPLVSDVVPALAAGQRTPIFMTQTTWRRASWYLRLPGQEGHPWAGVVRCEASADTPLDELRRLADTTALALPRFASTAHKDPRAPQNLFPIAGLERQLKHRLGDATLLYRHLRAAAAGLLTTRG